MDVKAAVPLIKSSRGGLPTSPALPTPPLPEYSKKLGVGSKVRKRQ